MKFLVVSDLHFDEECNQEIVNSISEKMILRVSNKMKINEKIIVFILGDIVESGGVGYIDKKFKQAELFFNILKKKFTNIKFFIVPGNHELCNGLELNGGDLDEFNKFTTCFGYNNGFEFTEENPVFSIDEAGFRLIFVDSTLERGYGARGKIDIHAIESNMGEMKNIILMHYPPCVQEGIDKNISNPNELIATHTNFIFYGHQHGAVKIPDFLEKDTSIHSVGSLLKQGNDINNEFILLDVDEGKINYAYRYVFNSVVFTAYRLFPQKGKNINSDGLMYDRPPKHSIMVVRRIKSISLENKKDYLTLLPFYGEKVDSAVKNNNLILLVGDAGSGKTYELQSIFLNFENNEEFFPIWTQLKDIGYCKIKEHIDFALKTIDRKIPLLIFDGLDELDGNEMDKFIKDIGSAVLGNPEIKIIISVRSNFKTTIEGFEKFKLLPLNDEEIQSFASSYGILSFDGFINAVHASESMSLARIPFYLHEMIKMFIVTKSLPKRIDLLNRIISFRFKESDKNHNSMYKQTLMANEYELYQALKKVSFYMQACREYDLPNISYTKLLSNEIRNMINYSGIITNQENEQTLSWAFEHSIFREYFLAQYLSKISFDEVLEVITYDDGRTKLRPSWFNIVSLMLPLNGDGLLKDWLIQNGKEWLCEFESDKINLNERNKIFIALMRDSFKKNIPIYSIYSEENLGRYFQSDVTIDFMLETLNNPVNEYSVLSVLCILCYCDAFFNKETDLKIAIFKYLDTTKPDYIVEFSIKALTQIFNDCLSEITSEMFSIIKQDVRPKVVEAMCILYTEAEVVDEYIDYVLEMIQTSKEMWNDYSVQSTIVATLRKVERPGVIVKVIDWICDDDIPNNFYEKDGLLNNYCVKASHLYNNEHKFKYMLKIAMDNYIIVVSKCDRRKSKIIKEFFENTHTLSEVFKNLLQIKLPTDKMMFIIEDIMDESLTDILVSEYTNGNVNIEAYKWYAKRLPVNSPVFRKLNNAVIVKEGRRIEHEVQINWEKLNKEGDQRYFDCLFNEVLFNDLLIELTTYLGENITCQELLGDSFSKVPYEREDLQKIRTAVYNCGLKSHKINEFLNDIDWVNFSVNEMYGIFQNRYEVNIKDGQKQWIKDYITRSIELTNFELYSAETRDKFKCLIFFIRKFNFSCDDEKLLQMLVLPWYLFTSSMSSGKSETLKFISERISDKNKLKYKVITNIREKTLDDAAKHTHIMYCRENNMTDAVEMATALCISKDEEARWQRYAATDYLIDIKGFNYLDVQIVPRADEELLRYLASKITSNNYNLIEKLIEENEKSEHRTLFLMELIKLNNSYGLNTYIELAKEIHTIPDFPKGESNIPIITEAIRDIKSISLLPELSELIKLCFADDFKDRKSYGLEGGISNALNNIIQVDKHSVKAMLVQILTDYSKNNKLVSFCNWRLNDIEKLINASSDIPWNSDKAEEFIKKHENIK